jgi:NCAIR mutase (PurE)-related protein
MNTHEIKLDFQRKERIGFEEAILCPGKTREHLDTILEQASAQGRPLLLTRMSREQVAALRPEHRERLDYEELSRTAYFGEVRAADSSKPSRVAIVAAGTSDAFVTREIVRTLAYVGERSTEFVDVGLAGMWRVMERVDAIRSHPVVIVVAGMDAALPTVVGGLVGSVLFAVPTSNGYGVAAGGESALRAVLASCSPGLAVLNIDNGYGAACAALRVLHALDRSASLAAGAAP